MNDTDHSGFLHAMGWMPVKKTGEVRNYKLGNFSSSLCLSLPHTNNIKMY